MPPDECNMSCCQKGYVAECVVCVAGEVVTTGPIVARQSVLRSGAQRPTTGRSLPLVTRRLNSESPAAGTLQPLFSASFF